MEYEVQVTTVTPTGGVPREALPRLVANAADSVVEIGSQALGASFSRFLEELSEVVSNAPEAIGPYVIDEIELSVAIGAAGSFRIASATADASLKLTLRRLA